MQRHSPKVPQSRSSPTGPRPPTPVLGVWGLCGIGTLGLCRCVAVPCQTVGRRAVACVCRCACVRSLTLESRVHEHSRRVLVCALSSRAERAGTRGAAACPHAGGGPMRDVGLSANRRCDRGVLRVETVVNGRRQEFFSELTQFGSGACGAAAGLWDLGAVSLHVGGLGPVGLLRDWDLGAVSLCRCAVPSRGPSCRRVRVPLHVCALSDSRVKRAAQWLGQLG
jgi:hypothetical protein